MENNKRISVVMSVYNEEPNILVESIESILNQSYKNLEFIIVLDNPKNTTLMNIIHEYKKKDNRIKLIKNEKNIGLVNSLNRGLKVSTGEFIARMDADDISYKNRLEVQFEAINKYQCDFVTARANVINEKGDYLYKLNNYSLDYKVSNKLLAIKCIHFHPTWFFKREVLDKVTEYHNREYVEDYDFLCRCAIHGFKIVTIEDYVIDVRVRESGITKSNIYEQYLRAKLVRRALKKSIVKNDIDLYESILDSEIQVAQKEKETYIKQFNQYKEHSTNFKKDKSFRTLIKLGDDILLKRYSREEFLRNIHVKIINRVNR